MASPPEDLEKFTKLVTEKKEAEKKQAEEKRATELTALSATVSMENAAQLAESARLAALAAEQGADFKVKGGTPAGSSLRKAYSEYLAKLGLPPDKKEEYEKAADDGKLHFQSEGDAEQFFKGLAEKGESFLAVHAGVGGLLGDYYLSIGDGTMLKGNIGPEAVTALAQSWDKIQDNPAALDELVKLLNGANPTNGPEVIACLKKHAPTPEATAAVARAAVAELRRDGEAAAALKRPDPDPVGENSTRRLE